MKQTYCYFISLIAILLSTSVHGGVIKCKSDMTCKAKNRICGLKYYTWIYLIPNAMPRCYGKIQKKGVFSCEGFETATDCKNALDIEQRENLSPYDLFNFEFGAL